MAESKPRSDESQRAHDAILLLLQLGFSQKEIAEAAGRNASTISRILGDPGWSVSSETANRLAEEAASGGQQRLTVVFTTHTPKLTVLDYCLRGGHTVPDGLREQIRQVLANVLIAAMCPTSNPVANTLPPGIDAVFAQLGDEGEYLLKLDLRGRTGADRVKLLIHELKHILGRLEERDQAKQDHAAHGKVRRHSHVSDYH